MITVSQRPRHSPSARRPRAARSAVQPADLTPFPRGAMPCYTVSAVTPHLTHPGFSHRGTVFLDAIQACGICGCDRGHDARERTPSSSDPCCCNVDVSASRRTARVGTLPILDSPDHYVRDVGINVRAVACFVGRCTLPTHSNDPVGE